MKSIILESSFQRGIVGGVFALTRPSLEKEREQRRNIHQGTIERSNPTKNRRVGSVMLSQSRTCKKIGDSCSDNKSCCATPNLTCYAGKCACDDWDACGTGKVCDGYHKCVKCLPMQVPCGKNSDCCSKNCTYGPGDNITCQPSEGD